ncbi:Endonuclease NucS [subsurface metagenome]
MNQEIGLLVNGVKEWYENIISNFAKHGKTWLQQSKELKSEFINCFNEQIRSRGYFFVFGYVQSPHSKVMYRFKVEGIISRPQRIAPPDETTPPYSSYDNTQGKCKDQSDFKYKTWLRVMECKQIQPIEKEQFINRKTGRPVLSIRGNPHYYVEIPEYLIEEEIEETPLPPTEEAIGITASLEKDLETFIIKKLEHIEKGLKLYPSGQQYILSTGKVDLLCTDANDNFVVIELKTGTVGSNVIGQILSYMAAVKQKLAKNKSVRGIIIGGDFDSKVKLTVSILPNLKLMMYRVYFKFDDVN